MLKNGVLPGEFLIYILITIPKGSRVDISNSKNYRAVALRGIFGKIIDNIIISNQTESLKYILYSLDIHLTHLQ